ncbi:serine/threonine-protein phosphatase 7 long form homolog [Rutidosis leptorrhynchoides]|uniref:serine/threonine-protein phosphatase 7 long form homolog n=1 Tax=Rutidosis leptorrhynchoides TaxID=125765 RepID=UPI003A9A41EE
MVAAGDAYLPLPDWRNNDNVARCSDFMGLPINGDVVSGTWHNMTPAEWADSVGHYLGIDQQRVRVYMLAAMSDILFPDGNSTSAPLNYVFNLINFEHLSWGSAVLAHVYRNLCRTAENTDQSGINGAMLLVQQWLYVRIPSLAPNLRHDIDFTSNTPLNGPYVCLASIWTDYAPTTR